MFVIFLGGGEGILYLLECLTASKGANVVLVLGHGGCVFFSQDYVKVQLE